MDPVSICKGAIDVVLKLRDRSKCNKQATANLMDRLDTLSSVLHGKALQRGPNTEHVLKKLQRLLGRIRDAVEIQCSKGFFGRLLASPSKFTSLNDDLTQLCGDLQLVATLEQRSPRAWSANATTQAAVNDAEEHLEMIADLRLDKASLRAVASDAGVDEATLLADADVAEQAFRTTIAVSNTNVNTNSNTNTNTNTNSNVQNLTVVAGAAGVDMHALSYLMEQGMRMQRLEDAASAAAAAVVTVALPQLQVRQAQVTNLVDGREFVYQSDMDKNGIFYFLGTAGLTKPYVNPGQTGVVIATASSLAVKPPSYHAYAACGRECVRCVTQPSQNNWFCFNLVDKFVQPTAYTLRHYDSYDTECLRNWRLEGSNNGVKWKTLITHKKDKYLDKIGDMHTWHFQCKKTYRMFRVLQTGPNKNGHFYMPLSGFELYGRLYSQRK